MVCVFPADVVLGPCSIRFLHADLNRVAPPVEEMARVLNELEFQCVWDIVEGSESVALVLTRLGFR